MIAEFGTATSLQPCWVNGIENMAINILVVHMVIVSGSGWITKQNGIQLGKAVAGHTKKLVPPRRHFRMFCIRWHSERRLAFLWVVPHWLYVLVLAGRSVALLLFISLPWPPAQCLWIAGTRRTRRSEDRVTVREICARDVGRPKIVCNRKIWIG